MELRPRHDSSGDKNPLLPGLLPSFAFVLALMISSCAAPAREVRPQLPSGKSFAVASWYGSDFHGRPTASGEIFDMYAVSCAHKTYPFGTLVNVTMVSNNRSVECKVNDRGPFVKGRDIDLSYGAAKRIGLLGPGVAEVMLEVNGRDDSYRREVRREPFLTSGPFAIQVGSFSDSTNAIRLKTILGLNVGNVYMEEAVVSGVRYFRVRIGLFSSMNDAVSLAQTLGDEGYPVLIVRADREL